MDKEKQDLRVRHTKQLLKTALLKIIREKSINKITVTELCREAHINRNTFYSHYSSPVELLDEIERNFADHVIEELVDSFRNNDYQRMLRRVCHLIYEERDLAQIILVTDGKGSFLEQILTASHERIMPYWSTAVNLPQKDLDYLFEYLAGGTYLSMSRWIQQGLLASPDDVADHLLQLNKTVLQNYIPNTDMTNLSHGTN